MYEGSCRKKKILPINAINIEIIMMIVKSSIRLNEAREVEPSGEVCSESQATARAHSVHMLLAADVYRQHIHTHTHY